MLQAFFRLAVCAGVAAPLLASPAGALRILTERCEKCHGAALQLSKLDLRSREALLKGGAKGVALIPGKPDESRLYRVVSGSEKPAMPMDGKLDASQIETLREWIASGAEWPASAKTSAAPAANLSALEEMQIPPQARQWWAFRLPVAVPPPAVGASHPIDAFLVSARVARGVRNAAPKAGKLRLARRAYLDLTGLPPSPAESQAFLQDNAPGAWERLIDRLLDSPAYGERWGRHWLDVARYADSNGYEHDFDRPNAWRYRDYVIQSFNKDKPWDRFLREQLAGDELPDANFETLTATGFLRNHARVGFREKDNPQFRFEYLDDMIATIGRGILGMTVQCARCHNHKFDPIPQKDYYRLQASLFGYVDVDHPLVPAREAQAYREAVAAVDASVKPLRERIRQIEDPYRQKLLRAKYEKFPANVLQAIDTPEARRTPGQVLLANQILRTVQVSSAEVAPLLSSADKPQVDELQTKIRQLEQRRPAPIPSAMGLTDGDYRFTPDGPGDEPAPGKGIQRAALEGSFLHQGPGRYQPPDSYFLFNGDTESRGSRMEPGFLTVATYGNPPAALPPQNGRTSGRRLALAEWIVSPENPLTTRVLVNRVWHHHFGVGLVPTLDNFGKMGEQPSHPELLDWLAIEFRNQRWSVKKLHRLIMTSEAYQMDSAFDDEASAAADPENRYLWRFRQQRLDAEVIRDSILAASGALRRETGGPPVFPVIQDEVLRSMKHGIWKQTTDGPEAWRRSVYVYRKRGLPLPLFEVFDLPDQNISCGLRNVSTVPTQALTLLNNEFVLRQASLLGKRVAESAPAGREAQVRLAYEITLSRPPRPDELRLGLEFLERGSLEGLAHVLLNLNEFVYLR